MMRSATFLILLSLVSGCGDGTEGVRVFAAASLAGIVPEEGATVSFAASSVLARQIAEGAPADVFLSANVAWVDDLAAKGLVAERAPILGNALVLVAPRGRSFAADLREGFDLPAAFPGRLAIAEPEHAPAGIYARQALTRLGWWDALSDRLAVAADVRAALMFVTRGECEAGIVYRTDARMTDGVEVVGTFPAASHDPIVYEAAVVAGGDEAAGRAYLERLRSAAVQERFAEHGFVPRADLP
jgi:molybdate transport system substrate-binding protein